MGRDINGITREIVDAAVKIHKGLGPGLLESVYESVLVRELIRRGLKVHRQYVVKFEFDGMQFDDGLRVDLFVEDLVVVELKSAEAVAPVHAKQLLTYLRLLNVEIGLLLNFGCETMRQGIRRVANKYAGS